MASPLPHEIVDHIIDFLHDDGPTLKSCSIVARSWLPSAQLHLFHHIVLHSVSPLHEEYSTLTDEAQRSNERLVEICVHNPRIASCIRSLQVQYFERRERAEKWEQICSSVAAVIERLPNITSLYLFRVNWATLTPSLTRALTRVLHSPSLKELSLVVFAIPTFAGLVSLLSHSTNLKALKITFMACANWEVPIHQDKEDLDYAPRSIELDRFLHVHAVNLHAFTEWFQQPYCAFNVQNLRSLRVHRSHRSTSFHFQGAALMLQCIGSSLRELELQGPYENHHNNVLHLGHSPHLRKVTLVNVHQSDSYTPVPWILSLLDPIDPKQVYPLQCLQINLYMDHNDVERTHQWQEWAALDTLLIERRFSSLGSLVIALSSVDPPPQAAVTLLADQFSCLLKNEKLNVEILLVRDLPIININQSVSLT